LASLSWRPFLFSLSGSHSLLTEVMILASANAAISPGGMARGGWRTGRRRKERVPSCGSVWGRIAPPPDEEFVGGGGVLWTFKEAVGRWRRRARTSALACSPDGDDDPGGGARGRRLSLARVTATTTLAEARADVGSRSRDGDDDAGSTLSRRRGGRWCSLAGATTSRWRGGRLEEHPQRATIDATINSVSSSGSRTACCRPREC
jgi:hypothetical protein